MAARNALSMPNPATPARCSHGISNGPNQLSDRDWSSGCSSQAIPMPSTTPTTAAALPSTTAPATITRRDCFGVPPVAAIRARLRCCLRALTANAGPASSTTSIRAITTISPSTARPVLSDVLTGCTSCGPLGATEAGPRSPPAT